MNFALPYIKQHNVEKLFDISSHAWGLCLSLGELIKTIDKILVRMSLKE